MSRTHVSAALRRQIRADAHAICGYCHSPEVFLGMPLDIEHIIPEALGGATVRENLWLACSRCNDFKGDRTEAIDPITRQSSPLFNPRTQRWLDHFRWSGDGAYIEGLTPTGRATVDMLQLNNDFILVARRFWIEAGRWPPPDDLPQ
ncbi:MAG TPA: HNH endonuclease signature motif containing protein [Ktedonobacterales bacterium]|nr:HNH endonuclease signature motif containing protein [Ktedonobacterales bacterium]